MVSVIRLNRPCPCGSGKLYKDCCAPGAKKTRRKRKKPQKNKSTASQRRQRVEFGLPELEIERALREYEQAVENFQALYHPIMEEVVHLTSSNEREFGPDLVIQSLHALEVAPQAGIAPEIWGILNVFALARGLCTNDFIDALMGRLEKRSDYQGVGQHFAVLKRLEFGLWHVKDQGDLALNITRVDGQTPPYEFLALDVTNAQFDEISRGIYAGVRVQMTEYSNVFICTPLAPQALKKFERAAKRQAWGNQGAFRPMDYEEDVLSLLVSPDCFETGQDDGRVFLDPSLDTFLEYEVDEFWIEFLDAIGREGLDQMPERDAYHDTSYFWYDRAPVDGTASHWSIAAAQAIEEGFDRLIQVLDAHRFKAFQAILRYSNEPRGPATLNYVAPMDKLLETIGLEPDGSVAHPSGHDALDYPVAVLDFDPKDATLKSLGLTSTMSIFEAIEHLDEVEKAPKKRAAFQAAVKAHIEAYRWAGIMGQRTQKSRPEGVNVSYNEFFQGLHKVMPARVMKMPLTAFEDPGRGTWKRLHKALAEEGLISFDAPLLVKDIPVESFAISATPGIGAVSVQNTSSALAKFVCRWPESEGFKPARVRAEISGEAADKFSSGLDDLDDLF